MKGFTLELYKRHGRRDTSNNGTSSRCEQIMVVGYIVRTWDDVQRRYVFTEELAPMRPLRVTTYNPQVDNPMVIIKTEVLRQWQFRLHDAQIDDDGRMEFTYDGMYSGVFADEIDTRWAALVGDHPVRLFDRHEWKPVFQRFDALTV